MTWARRIAGLDPPQVRSYQVVSDLRRMAPADAVDLVRDIQEAHVRGSAQAAVFMMSLQDALVRQMVPYDLVTALYLAATESGLQSVQRLLLGPRPRRREERSERRAGEGQDTLGMKTWKARTATRHELERLARDSDPRVIRNLLTNPRLRESDVLEIVARRPVSVAVLVEVAQSPRWNRRQAVQRGLVLNPYTPTEMALRLMTFLSTPDLAALSRDGVVHPDVKRQAGVFLAWRRGEEQPPTPVPQAPARVEARGGSVVRLVREVHVLEESEPEDRLPSANDDRERS